MLADSLGPADHDRLIREERKPMDKRFYFCAHRALTETGCVLRPVSLGSLDAPYGLSVSSPLPAQQLFNPPIRITSIAYPILSVDSKSYTRNFSASLRRASGADAARDAAHPCLSDTATTKKGRKSP
jgi:hypothetical protein